MLTEPDGPLPYIIIVLLLLISFFFAGSETAYASCNRHRIMVMAEDGNKRAKLALKIVERFETTIISTLVAINICHVAISVLATILAVNLLGATGSIVATILVTVVVFFFSEILPKNIAMLNSDKWALNASFLLYGFKVVLFPITFIFSSLLGFSKKAFNLEEDEEVFDEDDLIDVVEKVEEEGILDEEESDIIQAAIEFGDIKVKEVYTKRDNIIALDITDCNASYLKEFLNKYSYSRIPVYEGTIDNIIGVLHVRTYLKAIFLNDNINIKDILIKPYFVSPQAMIDDIFKGFKENKTHIAIVKSKNKTIGMVTMKDILEELVENVDDSDKQDSKVGDNNA